MATRNTDESRNRSDAASKSGSRTAESRRCPRCGRGSALKFHSDDGAFGFYCRWDDCNYSNLTVRD